ncbi:putative RNA-binding domain superfamily [Helianthus anomalus]
MQHFNVWLARRPLGYAFVDFDYRRDALDAIRDHDVYRNQCPLVEKLIKTSLKSQRGSFKNFFNRRKEVPINDLLCYISVS